MLTRLALTCINMFFPPLAVLLLTGPYTDTLLNCVFFLLGVIPSHIHGFYITCTYFHRKNKVRKGRYPGGPKSLIFDRKVWNGGASDQMVGELRVDMEEAKRLKDRRRRGKGESGVGGGRAQVGAGMDGRGLGCRDDAKSQATHRDNGMCEVGAGLGPRRSVLGELSGR